METFIIPRVIFKGPGSLEELKNIPAKRAVIVTGKGSMKKTGVIDKVQDYLRQVDVYSSVFDGVEEDPSFETCMKGAAFIQKEKPDIIIGLGGCSAIDAAKLMWVYYEYPDTKFEDAIIPFSIKQLRKKAQFVAIPSTSGTGTEVTCVSVITDREKGVKYPVISYEITPDYAIIDGQIAASMPKNVTANTGFDALSHNLEAYVSTMSNPYTDALAGTSTREIFENLEKVYLDGNNIEARQAVHEASCFAGVSFTNAFLGILHSMSHQLGATFGIPHGRANAILMSYVIPYNSKKTDKYNSLACFIGGTKTEDFIKTLEELRSKVGIESSLKEWMEKQNFENPTQFFKEKLNALVENTLKDPCLGCNPRTPDEKEMRNLFEHLFTGEKVTF